MIDLNEIATALSLIETAVSAPIVLETGHLKMSFTYEKLLFMDNYVITITLACPLYSFSYRMRDIQIGATVTASQISESFVSEFREKSNRKIILGGQPS